MSIASQIQAYADGLSDAYDVVSQRGGTIPAQKNMANLDTAIATIPAGSTPVTPTITSATYNSNDSTITITGTNFGSSPVVKVFNRAADEYQSVLPSVITGTSITIPAGNQTFGYYSRVVKVENGGFESDVKFVYADFENLGASGPEVVLWCYHSNSSKYPLDAYGATMANCSSGQYGSSLSNAFQTPYTAFFQVTPFDPQSTTTGVASPAVRGFEIKTGITTLTCSGNFLGTCRKLSQPVGLADVTTLAIYNGFLGGCTEFNAPIDTGRLEDFGAGFLTFCSHFNQPLDMSSVTNIGTEFLRDCMAFDQELSIIGTSGSHITIGANNFLRDALAQSKTITLEYCDISSGAYFIYDTMALKEVVVKNITIAATAASAFAVNRYAANCPAYGDGIMISGDSASVNAVLTNYPDQATTNGYRHLVQGTIS